MTGLRRLTIFLPIVLISVVQPSVSAQVRVSRQTPSQGLLVNESTDLRSGCILTTKAGTSPDRLKEWFSQLAGAPRSEENLKALVAAGQSDGLLAVAAVVDGVSLTVSWGPMPTEIPLAPGAITSTLRDLRTGRVLVVTDSAGADSTKAWLAALNAAKSEPDFTALLTAERQNGLISVTRVIDGVQIRTYWAVTQK